MCRISLALPLMLLPAGVRAQQPGKDGPQTVSAANTVLNRYAILSANAAAGATTLSVTNPGGANGLDPATLTAGDLLLVMQMQGATMDTSYRVVDFGSGNDEAFAIALQSDGKIVLAGYSNNGTNQDFAAMRFGSDGRPDASFGGAGWVRTAIGAANEQAIAVAIQPDGKIVLAGFADTGGGNNDFALVRYNADGTLDAGFGTGGKVTTPVLAGDDQARAVAIQTDGKIVAVGWANNGTNDDVAVVRYTAAGALDGTFGTGGKVTTPVGTDRDEGYAVAIQGDGKIVVAGDTVNASANSDVVVLRYLTGGGLDGTFGTAGKVTTPIGTGDDSARDLVLQSDGKIVVAGSSWNGTDFDFAVLRYTTAGALDGTFGVGGVRTAALGTSNDLAYGVALQTDGKIVAAGWSHNGLDWDYGLIRLTTAGALDPSFDVDGKLQAAVGNDNAFGEGVVVHPDGRIFVGGRSDNSFDRDFTLVGFDTDGTYSYGKVLNLGNAGRYELVPVASVAGSTITLGCPGGLENSYTTPGKVQVIKVPQYSTLTINAGASVISPAWNGQYGGVVALHVASTATLDGDIRVAQRGFRGGSVDPAAADWSLDWPDLVSIFQDIGGEKGEGIAGSQAVYDNLGGRYSRGAAANGGGGGGAHNGGGGGGANGNAGGRWTGQGFMDGAVTGAAAWSLDPGYISNGNALTTSPGGGRGGYTYSDGDQNALVLGPRNAAWGGNERREHGGLGGRPLQNDPTSRIFMGGGGGAGDGNGGGASRGGNGGGIVLLVADTVTGTGTIDVRGEAGPDTTSPNEDGPGGGGAGGTIVVSATSLSGVTLQADGGAGGNEGLPATPTEAEGPGGGGGGGFIAVSGGTVPRTANGGAGGTTLSPALTEFPTNGATKGAAGQPNELLVGLPGGCFSIACSPQVNYRSVGTDSGILYQTGSATINAGSNVVDFTGATLPAYVGQGDELVIGATTFYVLTRESTTRVTVQSNAASTLSGQAYTFRRAYNTFQAWETARQGDLIAEHRREIAVAYDDGARGFSDFTAGAVIDGSTTDSCHYMMITVAPGQRHFGVAGAGALVTGVSGPQVFQVSDEFTRIEWLQIANATVTTGVVFVDSAASGAHSSFSNLLIHDYTSSSGGALRLSADAVVRNSIVYNGDVGIRIDTVARATLENDTVYKMTTYGVQAVGGGTDVTVRNTISVGNTPSDFSLDQTISYFGYNLFSTTQLFDPVSCSGCVGNNQAPPGNLDNLFVTITGGSEDLHVEAASSAIDTGVDLSSSFTSDVEGDYRPLGAGWEIGADEALPAAGCPVSNPAWYDTAWSYRTAIVIDSSKVTGSLTDFPVLVQLPSDAALAADAQDTGNDILFTLSDGVTKLSHEIELFDGTTGELVAWVKVPFLSSGSSTVLYMYFGNPTVGSQQNVFNTWSSGYEGVWHLKEASGSGAYIRNSAKNAYNGTPSGTVFDPAGKIDGARDFTDSGTQTISLGGSTALFNAWPLFSYEFWIRPDYPDDATWEGLGEDLIFSSPGGPPPVNLVRIRRMSWDAPGTGELQSDINFVGAGTQFPIVTINRQAWNHVLYSYDGSRLKIYVNGVIDYNMPFAGDALVANTTTYSMGAGGGGAFRGPLDEVRIATAGRTNTWVQTEFNNQNDPASFFSVCGSTTEVDLASFEARGGDGVVDLTWRTASELDNLGFHLYRSSSAGGPYERITSSLIPGLGSTPVGAQYSYRDADVGNGVTYFYELEDVDTSGRTKRHGPVSATPESGASLAPATESGDHGDAAEIRYGNPEASTFRILKSDRNGVVLELRTEGFFARPRDDGSVEIEIPGFVNETEEGTPAIPVKRSWVEAAPGRGVRLAAVQRFDVDRIGNLRPADTEVSELVAGKEGTLRLERRSSRRPRARNDRPAQPARILETGYQGSVKKVFLEMAPLRWDAARRELVLARRLVVRLRFAGPEGARSRAGRTRGGSSSTVLTRLATRERGLYAVRYEDLFGRGGRRGNVSELRLSRLGEAVAYHLEPEGRPFGPGSTLYFFSEGASLNPYGREAIYELELGVAGARMSVVDSIPRGGESSPGFYWQRVDREENHYYQAGLLDAPDLWLWDLVSGGQSKRFAFELNGLRSGDDEPGLELHLQGASDFFADPDHHLRIFVNDTYLTETSWNGKDAKEIVTRIPSGALHEGENALEIENVGDTEAAYSMVMVDRFTVRYPRALVAEGDRLEGSWSVSGAADVSGLTSDGIVLDTTGDQPQWLHASSHAGSVRFESLAGHRYFVAGAQAMMRPEIRPAYATSLLDKPRSADYLAIGPRSFLAAASDLLRYRSEQGLAVEAVAVEDIYDELGFGESRPEAIRDFIANAYETWGRPGAPLRYVLLLGDGTYDFKDYYGLGNGNPIPPYMIKTRYLWTASDPALAAVHGEDPLPDLAIGRLPASSTDEVKALTRKIIGYETARFSLTGPVVLVTDNADGAGNFFADAKEIAAELPVGSEVRFLPLSQLGASRTRESILNAFDEGASVMSYLGHGGIQLWATEDILDTSAVPLLNAQERQPILLTMNCLNGYFHFPFFDSLAEALVDADGRGAIAAISPTGLSLDEPAHIFHRELMKALFDPRNQRLGDAVLAAEAAYAQTGSLPELLAIYHLFGDPALRLR